MKIQKLVVDATNFRSDLCELGAQFHADKSPYHANPGLHKHAYTATYTQAFAPLKNKAIDFAEIGLAGGSSAAMWLNYFPKANCTFLDCDKNLLENFRKHNTPRTTLTHVDMDIPGDLTRVLNGNLYDVILDDASHRPDHQLRMIREATPFIKSGGYCIVEDIVRASDMAEWEEKLKDVLPEYCSATWIICNHEERWEAGWSNGSILMLVKS